MAQDQVILITGAAGRLGSAILRAVIAAGWRAVAVDVDESRLRLLHSEFSNCSSILPISLDAGLPYEADKCLDQALGYFGKVDAAIHSAYPRSKGWGAPFEDLKPEDLYEDLSCHLGGAILFSQRMIRFFQSQGYGNLIHVSSIMGVVTPRFDSYQGTTMTSPVEYTAIKSGIISTVRYLAKYCKGQNIRVNCISPGGMLDSQPQSFLEKYQSHCNSKGMLNADDLVSTVLFLLSSNSLYINGQNIVIDDGWSL
jgi:NAD(P)-dependent dehydrogenase (short-subunit alcohol dehydrogenase family)